MKVVGFLVLLIARLFGMAVVLPLILSSVRFAVIAIHIFEPPAAVPGDVVIGAIAFVFLVWAYFEICLPEGMPPDDENAMWFFCRVGGLLLVLALGGVAMYSAIAEAGEIQSDLDSMEFSRRLLEWADPTRIGEHPTAESLGRQIAGNSGIGALIAGSVGGAFVGLVLLGRRVAKRLRRRSGHAPA